MIGAIDVRDLVGDPGRWRSARISGTIDDLATELAGLPADTPVTAELLLESLEDGILASGRLLGTLSLRCARCLTSFEQSLDIEIRELFTTAPEEDSDEYPLGADGFLDPDQMIRDVIGVELPFAPVCRPGCRGLCGRCGGDLNLGECTCSEPEIDPRWAGLGELFEVLHRSESGSRQASDETTDHPRDL
jgi:uncharacterized protein